MSRRICYRHQPADNFIVGSLGTPGERQFYIQISSTVGLNTVAITKTQLIALVERFEELIRELKRKKLASDYVLHMPASKLVETLEFPVEEDFHAGVMGITWESENEKISLEIQEYSDLEEFSDLLQIDSDTSDFDFPPDILQAQITVAQVRGFIDLADKVISAGRAICPFCSLPINTEGHLCPRANGYKR